MVEGGMRENFSISKDDLKLLIIIAITFQVMKLNFCAPTLGLLYVKHTVELEILLALKEHAGMQITNCNKSFQ